MGKLNFDIGKTVKKATKGKNNKTLLYVGAAAVVGVVVIMKLQDNQGGSNDTQYVKSDYPAEGSADFNAQLQNFGNILEDQQNTLFGAFWQDVSMELSEQKTEIGEMTKEYGDKVNEAITSNKGYVDDVVSDLKDSIPNEPTPTPEPSRDPKYDSMGWVVGHGTSSSNPVGYTDKEEEIERTLSVIKNRRQLGLDTSSQNKWLDGLLNKG